MVLTLATGKPQRLTLAAVAVPAVKTLRVMVVLAVAE
jgi:hypothetical protein